MFNQQNDIFKKYQINCSESQAEQLKTFFDLLIDWNKRVNLTSITEPNEVNVKHFFDSLTPALFFRFNDQKIIDVGAGAGFPGIPLKICFPNLRVTLLDSLKKRVTFLEHVINRLQLENINCIHGRAEEAAKDKKFRENYDIAISRAVAKLNVLAELNLPFVKEGGLMIALKGPNVEAEIEEARQAIEIFGGNHLATESILLPENYGQRKIVFIKKIKKTPQQYPRKSGTPNRKPII